MLSIAPLASPDYYLGAAASSGEAFHYFAGDAISPSDPLLRQGRWLGSLGSDIGLNPDAPVTAKDFEWSVKRNVTPDISCGGPVMYMMDIIKGAADFGNSMA